MNKTIIIPAYNEEQGIEAVIKRCKKVCEKGDEILVVDDGSRDKTYEIAKKTGVTVVKHPQNKGKAFALKTGFDNAKNDIVITIDADCTYPPEYIPEMMKYLKDYDIVVGSRFRNGIPKGLPIHRGLANIMGAQFTSILLRRKLTDITSGLRAFRKDIIKNCPIRAKGLDFEAEFTARAITRGYKYKEIPIIYEERAGQSKLKFFNHIAKFTVAILRGKFQN